MKRSRHYSPDGLKPGMSLYRQLQIGVLIAIILALVGVWARGGDQSVTLAWDRVDDTNVTAYIVNWGNASKAYYSATNAGNVDRTVIGGLDAGTNYYFIVRSLNVWGFSSDPSEEVSTFIPPKPRSPVIITNYWNVPPLDINIRIVPAILAVPNSTTIQTR
jgi:hypothetical protein